MADFIGRVPVPAPVKSGAVFPTLDQHGKPTSLCTEYGYGMTRDWKIAEHRFGDLATIRIVPIEK